MVMVTEWPGENGKKLTKKQVYNFKSAYKLYEILFDAYKSKPPIGVSNEFWKNRVIQAFNGQVYFNLPTNQEVLYTKRISKNALHLERPTKEHFHPRRAWVKWRLLDIPKKVTFEIFFDLYCKEGGRYHKTTKEENSDLETWHHNQGDPKPTKIIADRAYEENNIILVDDPRFK